MNSFNSRLDKILKNNKKSFYIFAVFLIISFAFFFWAYYIKLHTVDTGVTLHQLIANESSKEKDIVSLEVWDRPYVFAEYDRSETSSKYYFLVDENYLYVGYLDYNTFKKLDKNDINEHPITIKGVTKKIPDDIIQIAIKSYNEVFDEEILTQENYKDYIGEIAIDTVSSLTDNVLQNILGVIFLFSSIIILIIYLIRTKKIKKVLKSEEWQRISYELESDNTVCYDNFSLYLTDNYIVDGSNGLTIIPYQDLIWIYIREQRYNGIVMGYWLITMNKNKKNKSIAPSGGKKKNKEIYNEIINIIREKNNAILVGYTKDNQDIIKNYN